MWLGPAFKACLKNAWTIISETNVPELLFSCLSCLPFVRHASGTLTGTFRHSDITPFVRNSQNLGKGGIKCYVCACLKKCLNYLSETGVPELLFSCPACLSFARHASGGERYFKVFCQAFYLSKQNNLKIVWDMFQTQCLEKIGTFKAN